MQLRTPTSALIWELWRNSRAGVFTSIFVTLLFFPFMMTIATHGTGTTPVSGDDLTFFSSLAFLGILIFSIPSSLAGAWVRLKNSDSSLSLSFIRPIGTVHFTVTALIFGCMEAVFMYLFAVFWMHYLYGMVFPVFPGMISTITFTIAVIAIAWGFRSPVAGVFFLFIAASIFLIIFVVNDPSLINHKFSVYSYTALTVLSWQYALIGLMPIPLLYIFLITSLKRQRRNETFSILKKTARIYAAFLKIFPKQGSCQWDTSGMRVNSIPIREINPKRGSCPAYPFSSTRNALIWHDWHKTVFPVLFTWVVFLGVIVIAAFFIVNNIAFVPPDQRLPQKNYFPAFVLLFAVLCSTGFSTYIAYKMSGIRFASVPEWGRRWFTTSLTSFESTLPSNAWSLYTWRLWILLAGMAFMILCAMAAAWLWSVFSNDFSPWRDTLSVLVENPSVTCIFSVSALLFWIQLASFLIALPYVTTPNNIQALLMVLGLFFMFGLLDEATQRKAVHFMAPAFMAMGTLLLLYSLYVFVRAWKWGVLWGRGIACIGVVWAIVFIAARHNLFAGDLPSFPNMLFIAGLWCVSLTGFALAPLSIALSRHQ